MRAALYIGGVSVQRVASARLQDLTRALGVEADQATYVALDWEGTPLGVVACREQSDGGRTCQVTLADHPEAEAVLLALVKSVWRRNAAPAYIAVSGTPLKASRLSPPFSLRADALPASWKAFLALPHRYLEIP